MKSVYIRKAQNKRLQYMLVLSTFQENRKNNRNTNQNNRKLNPKRTKEERTRARAQGNKIKENKVKKEKKILRSQVVKVLSRYNKRLAE